MLAIVHHGFLSLTNMTFTKYIEREQPHKGFFPLEWAVLAYMALTLIIVLFTATKLHNPDAMIWGRVRIAAVTVAMWVVYRLLPCRLTRMLRVVVQMLMLGWWYTDTYNLNLLFPNHDPFFASLDQQLFGCQPALLFAERFPQIIVSELMDLGYVSYYPIIALVLFWYFFRRYDEFERCAFIIMVSFFSFYVFYDLLPVTGPMYYYPAVGVDQVAKGVFPEVGNYFATHNVMMPSPGYTDGIFHQMLDAVHSEEHPTAAFPSSHVGVCVICMMLLWRTRCRWLFIAMVPLAVLLCLATVYIRAHYAIDAIAGFVIGVAFYFLWSFVAKRAGY